MNTITIAEIKRGGMAALDQAMNRGTTTIMKRNRPAAIVLTPVAYEALLAKVAQTTPGNSTLDWLLHMPEVSTPALDDHAMAQRLAGLQSDWLER